MAEEEDQDVYVAQLREVFDSCDAKGDGFLTKDGLIELCQKLQLEDQVSKLLAQLLGDKEDGEVRKEFCCVDLKSTVGKRQLLTLTN